MRTLAIFHLGELSGPAKTLQPRLERLAELGTTEVVLPSDGRAARLYEQIGPVRVLPYEALTYPYGLAGIPGFARRFLRDLRAFRRCLRDRPVDAVLVVTMMLPAAVLAARLERVAVVVYAAEIFSMWGSRTGRSLASRALLRYTGHLADTIVCCSHAVSRQFDPSTRAAVETIYPGISVAPATADRTALRRRFGIPPEAHCVAAVGSISAGRGQDILIRAIAELRRDFGDVYCLLVGEPHPRRVDLAYRESLRELMRELGVADLVRLAGVVEPVSDAYEATDVVVNPARLAESFGRVGVEALLAGRPVIAARVGAIPSVLRDGVDALLVEPDDPTGLASAIRRLSTSKEFAARLVRSGRARVLADFDPTEKSEEFVRLIQRTVVARNASLGSRRGAESRET